MINSEHFKLIKHLADIKDSNGHNIELNYGQWYDNEPTYDLRKPNVYGGFTITENGAKKLALILGKEFGIFEREAELIDVYVMDFARLLIVGDINWSIDHKHNYKDIRLVLPIRTSTLGTTVVSARFDMEANVYIIPHEIYKKIKDNLYCGTLLLEDWLTIKDVTRFEELAIKQFYKRS